LQSEVIVSKKLSKPDISIYAYAKSIDAIILTSDKPLRKEAPGTYFNFYNIRFSSWLKLNIPKSTFIYS
jgi:predicted DNA-binding protein (UPF0278 family)